MMEIAAEIAGSCKWDGTASSVGRRGNLCLWGENGIMSVYPKNHQSWVDKILEYAAADL